MDIGDVLKQERLKRKLTQAEMATLLDIKRSTYSLYESKKRQPKIEQLQKIAALLRVETKELLPKTDYNRILGDKALDAYDLVLEQVIGLRGHTFGITEDDDSLYITYSDGILKVTQSMTVKLQEDIESYTEFKLQELKNNNLQNFIPKNKFDYLKRVCKE